MAKWLEVRRQQPKLEVLLVVNPNEGTPDSLEGAEKEGKRVMELLERQPAVNITRVAGAEATLRRLRDEFCSGRYDIVHYAGHAQKWLQAGAGVIGGCCGTGPKHIARLKQLVEGK